MQAVAAAAGAAVHKVGQIASHAAGASCRAGHGSLLVEGELMSTKKPMSPFSGQVGGTTAHL